MVKRDPFVAPIGHIRPPLGRSVVTRARPFRAQTNHSGQSDAATSARQASLFGPESRHFRIFRRSRAPASGNNGDLQTHFT